MRAHIIEGSGDWLGHIDGEPTLIDFDTDGCTLRLETEHGDLVVRLTAGERDSIDPVRFRAELAEAMV